MGAGRTAAEQGPARTTILVSVWAVSTLFWSIFTEPHRTYAARILLCQPLWLVRIYFGDSTWVQDLALSLGLHSLYGLIWTRSWTFTTINDIRRIDWSDQILQIYLQIFTLLGLCAGFAGSLIFRDRQIEKRIHEGPLYEQRIEESLLPPLLLTSRTSHSRLFPEKHGFSYSYLFVGIPVGFQGRVTNVLSVDSQRPGWFDVRSAGYLNRTQLHLGLGEKLKRYLHTQGVTDRDYSFAYLVTAPRFLGYSFNPASFWYLYDSDTRLKYMIVEVNNTFDERRLYFLKSDDAKVEDSPGSTKTLTFTNAWEKDFHVSPFNSRKGSYSLKAVDPLAAFQETGNVKIDNTITLRSSKDHAKIVARVWSEDEPIEAHKVTAWHLAKFIAGWWWVGLATFPRILYEASKLFFQRKLHVWYRPEVANTSIGRPYTNDEQTLEEFFRSFLTASVEHSNKPLRVIYEPAHNDGEEIVLYSPGFTYEEAHERTVTVKILSPAFYSRFVHYAHAKEAFDRECLATDDKNRTLVVEGANALPMLLDSMRTSDMAITRRKRPGLLDAYRWDLLRRLRCPPAVASYPSDESRLDDEYTVRDIRAFQYSELDKYVRNAHSDSDAYRRVATKLFMAERIALGIPIIVAFLDMIVRSVLVLAAMGFCDSFKTWDVFRPRNLEKSDMITATVALLLANGTHLWSFVKG